MTDERTNGKWKIGQCSVRPEGTSLSDTWTIRIGTGGGAVPECLSGVVVSKHFSLICNLISVP